jgi:Universal stress protein UspA and related nucleotide-binding proteins
MNASDLDSSGDRPVLLCYDGSPDAAEAIEQAGELIGGGPALVLYVWLPPSALMLAGKMVADNHPLAPAIQEFDAAAAKDAERTVAEGAELASRAGFEATPLTERAGHGTWRAIVKIADEHDARAVVVGSHGRSAAASAVLGSVSHGVVNHCRRPVVVAPCSRDHADAGA